MSRTLSTLEGFDFVKSVEGVSEYSYAPNGLQVLIYEDHAAPIAGVQVVYRVGSRNELPGTTGYTHFLEHMLFRGTVSTGTAPEFDSKFFEKVGGYLNASTWMDRTNYYEVVPKEFVPHALRFEADRMRNLLLRSDHVDMERGAVLSEYDMYDNEPDDALAKLIAGTAFTAHPYRVSTIGFRSDIERATPEALRAFYDTYYHPDNATVIVAGDVEPDTVLAEVAKAFGSIPKAGHAFPDTALVEPPQCGERTVRLSRSGGVARAVIAYKIPNLLHPDGPALTLLTELLGGSRSSILYRGLVDRGQVKSAGASTAPFRDPYLLELSLEALPGARSESLVVLADRLLKDAESAFLPKDLARVKESYATARAWKKDGIWGVFDELAEGIAIGDWTAPLTMAERIAGVSLADVRRVFREYFVRERRTIGLYDPLPVPKKAKVTTKPKKALKKVAKRVVRRV